jgi:hypothetical protein
LEGNWEPTESAGLNKETRIRPENKAGINPKRKYLVLKNEL